MYTSGDTKIKTFRVSCRVLLLHWPIYRSAGIFSRETGRLPCLKFYGPGTAIRLLSARRSLIFWRARSAPRSARCASRAASKRPRFLRVGLLVLPQRSAAPCLVLGCCFSVAPVGLVLLRFYILSSYVWTESSVFSPTHGRFAMFSISREDLPSVPLLVECIHLTRTLNLPSLSLAPSAACLWSGRFCRVLSATALRPSNRLFRWVLGKRNYDFQPHRYYCAALSARRARRMHLCLLFRPEGVQNVTPDSTGRGCFWRACNPAHFSPPPIVHRRHPLCESSELLARFFDAPPRCAARLITVMP